MLLRQTYVIEHEMLLQLMKREGFQLHPITAIQGKEHLQHEQGC